jgi:hypothetical protein
VFAERWVNWSWRDVAAQQRALADLADAPYAAQLRADAAHAGVDRSLFRARPFQAGRIVAIVIRANGRRRSAVVVTHERSFTDGVEDAGGARYRVYLASLVRHETGWRVHAWQPQP